jgi:hypothetical protein
MAQVQVNSQGGWSAVPESYFRVRLRSLTTSLYATAILTIKPRECYATTNSLEGALERARDCNSTNEVVYAK